MIVTCVLDRKAGFDGLSIAVNEAVAIRNFKYAICQNGVPNFAPADFELYKIGEWNQKTGVISAIQVPELLINGLDCLGEK